MNVDWRIKTFSTPIMIAFFMLLGYLEAGWLGSLAGIVLYGIAVLSILTALIPFIGAYFWYNNFIFLANNLGSFIAIPDLIFKITWIVGVIAISITLLTSILTIIVLIMFIRWWLNRNKKKADITSNNIIDSIIHIIPSELVKGFNITNLNESINKIFGEIKKLWAKLNVKFIGSAAVFTGIGIASHDFIWESEVHEAGMSRPTHGAYIGLQIAVGGMHTIISDLPLVTQIKRLILCYFGVIICYVSFFTMQFIPRGISRIVNHFLWWTGIALIVYNWYQLMEKDINNVYQVKMGKKSNALGKG